jgi:hypothetical protein
LEDTATAASGHGGSATSESSSTAAGHSTTASGSTAENSSPATASTGAHEQQPAAPSSSDTAAAAASAEHHAKRAILMVSDAYANQKQYDYNPMEMAKSIQKEHNSLSNAYEEQHFHWTIWCKSIAATIIATSMQLIASGGSYYNEEDYANNITSSYGGHHLMRRSEAVGATNGTSSEGAAVAGGEGFTNSLTMAEISFVYKIFLIFAGLILVMNSLIKALNTKISGMYLSLPIGVSCVLISFLVDIYGKVIIGSRIINAIVLWSLCALPFAKLDAIVLLCTMVGSLLFQATIDLLD